MHALPLFLVTDIYFLIAVIAQIFIPNAKLSKSAGTPTNKANAEIEAQPLTAGIT